MGKAIFFRADKVHHSAEIVNTVKRAITLFINVKQTEVIPEAQPVVRSSDMSPELEADALEVGKQAMKRYKLESDIADYIKTAFDEKHGGDWHCIVGKTYGSSITPADGNFIYFSHNKLSVLLFK